MFSCSMRGTFDVGWGFWGCGGDDDDGDGSWLGVSAGWLSGDEEEEVYRDMACMIRFVMISHPGMLVYEPISRGEGQVVIEYVSARVSGEDAR